MPLSEQSLVQGAGTGGSAYTDEGPPVGESDRPEPGAGDTLSGGGIELPSVARRLNSPFRAAVAVLTPAGGTWLVPAIALIAFASALAGILAATGSSRAAALLPVALASSIVLAALALWRFEVFVIAVLVVRASLDAAKLSPGSVGVDPAMLVGYLVLLAALLWLAVPRQATSRTGSGVEERTSAVTWAGVGMVVAAAISVIGATSRTVAAFDVARVAAAVAMLAIVDRFVSDRRRARAVLMAVLAASLVPMAVALYQAAGGTGARFVDGFSRVRGTFVHPNPLSLFLTFLLIIGVAALFGVHGRARLIVLAYDGVVCSVLLLTYARGAWIAAVVGVVVIALCLRKWWLVALVCLGIGLLAVAVPSSTQRFADVGREDRSNGDPSNSLSWRLQYWRRSLDLLEENPVTGVGIGMVGERMPEGVPPHNDYVRALVETGVVGLASYLILIGALAVTAWRALRAGGARLTRAFAAGYTGGIAAFVLVATTANVVTQVVVLWYVFALTGVALAVGRGVSLDVPPER